MYPATPTPIAVASGPALGINIHVSSFRIWAFADEAIMMWQRIQDHNMGTVIQIAVILIMIIFFVPYLIRLAQGLTNEGAL